MSNNNLKLLTSAPKSSEVYNEIVDNYGDRLPMLPPDEGGVTYTLPAVRVSGNKFTMVNEILDRSGGRYRTKADVLRAAIHLGIPLLYRLNFEVADNGTSKLKVSSVYEQFLQNNQIQVRMQYIERVKNEIDYLGRVHSAGVLKSEELQHAKETFVLDAPDLQTREQVEKMVGVTYEEIVNKIRIIEEDEL